MTEEQEIRAIALKQAVKSLPDLDPPYVILDVACVFENYIKEGWEIVNE